jgi:hypothetical protein
MKNKNAVVKGLVALAIVAGVASIATDTKPRAAVAFSVGAYPGYGYGYGYDNCSYVDAAGIIHYYPCGNGYYPGIGFSVGTGWGWGGGYGGRRWGGHRGGWHHGGGHRGGGHHGGGRHR